MATGVALPEPIAKPTAALEPRGLTVLDLLAITAGVAVGLTLFGVGSSQSSRRLNVDFLLIMAVGIAGVTLVVVGYARQFTYRREAHPAEWISISMMLILVVAFIQAVGTDLHPGWMITGIAVVLNWCFALAFAAACQCLRSPAMWYLRTMFWTAAIVAWMYGVCYACPSIAQVVFIPYPHDREGLLFRFLSFAAVPIAVVVMSTLLDPLRRPERWTWLEIANVLLLPTVIVLTGLLGFVKSGYMQTLAIGTPFLTAMATIGWCLVEAWRRLVARVDSRALKSVDPLA